MLKFLKIGFFCLSISAFLACSGNQLSSRDKGVLGGAAIGSGLGAIIGHKTGSTGAGVAIGGAAGAITGGLIGDSQDGVNNRANEQEERLRRQEYELERQRRELDELRRQRGDTTYRPSDSSPEYGRQDDRYYDRY